MDLTTFTVAALLALGLLGADAVLHAGSVEVEAAIALKDEPISIDEVSLAEEFQGELDAVTRISSVVPTLEIRPRGDTGVGMALAQMLGAKKLAYAVQRQFGYGHDTIRFTLFTDSNELRGLIHGDSHVAGHVHRVMVPKPDEPLITFVHRSALWTASQLAPYSTALYLVQKHASDRDFAEAIALIDRVKALLPATPMSFDRAMFDNLLGLIALFKNDPQAAKAAFGSAMSYDLTNPVPFINAAFVDVQLGDYKTAAERMAQLVRDAPPRNRVLLATAYMTWGAALMGSKDLRDADRMLAQATAINPRSATAYALYAEAKELQGDRAAAERLGYRAGEETATFENYAEMAALYFHLAWQGDQPVTPNKFSNPTLVTLLGRVRHAEGKKTQQVRSQ
jgi:tetratricopeptide (TPR) repeat protein